MAIENPDEIRADQSGAVTLPPALFEARGLSLKWDGDTKGSNTPTTQGVFTDVSFSLSPGDCLLIRGASGSGKSSLLRSLARLEPLAQGEVLWRGQSAHGKAVPGFRRRVAYTAQTPARYPLTVSESFREVLEFAEGAAEFDEQRALSYCSKLLLPEFILSRKLSELSGGELKRVQIVRSILADPSVWLLDEPTAGLDEHAGAALCRLLSEWLVGERALVVVSHEPLPLLGDKVRYLILKSRLLTPEHEIGSL